MKRIDENGSFSSSNGINQLHSMSVSLNSKDDDIKNKYIINQQFLSSYFNLFILFFYQTFTIIGTAACAAAGIV